mmetsp:Transcript_35992/g.37358  ORF Transcript_35992/g.37358 Transcript_35992/m.37358 type:complete len:241 (-) Transcript_35992:31-753(-)
MERVWKEFGKHTPAGKLLYDLYGVGFKPEEHISYPEIKATKKKQETKLLETKKNTQRGKTTEKVLSKINYPSMKKESFPIIPKVDLIKKRKTKADIDNNLIQIKHDIKPPQENKAKNRKQQIEKLQDTFQYKEKKYLPERARPPKVVIDEEILNESNKMQTLNSNNLRKANLNNQKSEDELTVLYNKILCEIDERYKFMDEMNKLGDQSQNPTIMSEIKARIQELKTIEKLRKQQVDQFN